MVPKLFLFLPFISIAFAGGRVFPADPAEPVLPNELLVKLRSGASSSVLARLAPGAAASAVHNSGLQRLRLPAHIDEAFMRRLADDPAVEYVEPNRIRSSSGVAVPSDPSYSSQWALTMVKALDAWRLLPDRYLTAGTAGTNRVKVAVLDTGADCTHPDFRNAGGTSVYSSAGGQLSPGGGAPVATTIPAPACVWQDDHGHGTHVAGTIAAGTNNSTGVSALGYPVELLIYKVLNASGQGDDATIAGAIVAAVNAGAKVVSLSLGGPGYSQSLQDAVDYAWKRNALVVAAAGNLGSSALFFPAGAHRAVSVAAVDASGNRPSWSNYGASIDVAAPGVSIVSTARGGGYAAMSGTSMATPHVSALAGLIATATPGLSASGIVQRIQRSANSTAAGGGWQQYLGYGKIDAWRAISGNLRLASVGSISGQVRDAGGLPVAATVTVDSVSIATGPTGLFRFANLSPGDHLITAAATGYPAFSGTVSTIPGADTDVTIQLAGATGTFQGIISAAGGVVEGAIVQALQNGLVVAEAVANAAGHFSLKVTPGAYEIRASQAAFVAATAPARSVTAGGNTAISLTLARLGTLGGIIKEPSGVPVPNAAMHLENATVAAGTTADATGAYLTVGLPSGNYSVTAAAPGFLTFTGTAGIVNDINARLDITLMPVTVTVSPGVVSLGASGTAQFSAAVSGGGSQAVTWSISPAVGTITSAGLYRAPLVITVPQTITVRAVSMAHPTRSGTATVALSSTSVALSSLVLSPATIAPGASSPLNQVSISGPAPAGGAVVTLTSSDTAAATVPPTVTIPAGATASNFTITAQGITVAKDVTIAASYGGVTKTAILSVRPGTAIFAGSDAGGVKGNWKGIYGSRGYYLINNAVSLPAGITVTPSGHQTYVFATATSDSRALQEVSGGSRFLSAWKSTTVFEIDVLFSDSALRKLSLYCVDFNSTTRSQKIEILDVSGRVLDTRSLSSFWQGVYLSWNVSGAVKIRVTRTGAYNGLVSALFLD